VSFARRSKLSLHHFPRRGQRQFVAMFDAARQFIARYFAPAEIDKCLLVE
jgi:hypothetical protein